MKRLFALLVTLIALSASGTADATGPGYVTGPKADMQWIQQWDAWLRGLPVPGIPQCPPNRPQYLGCMGPWGPCGNWYSWTYYYWPVIFVSGTTWKTYLDEDFPDRVQLLAETSDQLDWSMFLWLAQNTNCPPTPTPRMWLVYFDETQTRQVVVDRLLAYWMAAVPE